MRKCVWRRRNAGKRINISSQPSMRWRKRRRRRRNQYRCCYKKTRKTKWRCWCLSHFPSMRCSGQRRRLFFSRQFLSHLLLIDKTHRPVFNRQTVHLITSQVQFCGSALVWPILKRDQTPLDCLQAIAQVADKYVLVYIFECLWRDVEMRVKYLSYALRAWHYEKVEVCSKWKSVPKHKKIIYNYELQLMHVNTIGLPTLSTIIHCGHLSFTPLRVEHSG